MSEGRCRPFLFEKVEGTPYVLVKGLGGPGCPVRTMSDKITDSFVREMLIKELGERLIIIEPKNGGEENE